MVSRRAVRTLLAALATTAACGSGLPGVASASAPSDPRCLSLAAGRSGLLVGGEVPTTDSIAGQRPDRLGAVASAAVARTLPDTIAFQTRTEGVSEGYAFALREGALYARPAKGGVITATEPWRVMRLPECLDGSITEISVDRRLLLVLGPERQIYTHNLAGDLSPERWTWRWGPYFWTGVGMAMFPDARAWATSSFDSDERFLDTSGREQAPIGVATVYVLRSGGRRITYLDPWLPNDESREVCGPRRGTVPLVSLAAAGSTVFAVSRRAELFTRLYDFDVSGANTVFGAYSWQQDRPATDTRWQLPGPEWVRQPVPPGTITDRLTIMRTGLKAGERVLRVEGRTPRGRIGYWEKPIDGPRSSWRFTHTGGKRVGTPLSRRSRARDGKPDDHRYAGVIDGAPAEIRDLNAECSPATLRVTVAPDLPLDLTLHTSDGMRQETRAHGLDDTPREYNGAIEVPARTWAALDRSDPRLRAWIDEHLGGRRIATAPVALTRTRLKFLAQCWELTRDGKPVRADLPRVPPDLGMTVGRQTEREQDGRPVAGC